MNGVDSGTFKITAVKVHFEGAGSNTQRRTQCKDIAHMFLHMSEPDFVFFETRLLFVSDY
jgi:hypothetical protein